MMNMKLKTKKPAPIRNMRNKMRHDETFLTCTDWPNKIIDGVVFVRVIEILYTKNPYMNPNVKLPNTSIPFKYMRKDALELI